LLVLRWAPVTYSDTSEEFGWLRVEQFGAVSSGTDGSSVMSATSKDFVRGHIWAVHLDWADSVTTTSDITLTGADPTLTILVKADSATDAWFYPSVAQNKNTDASALTTYDRVPINSLITAAVAQSSLVTTTNLVTVTVFWGQ
jgi:hypothetical protein